MKKSIKFYIKREFLIKDESAKRLANEYLAKAKNNLITLKILETIQNGGIFRKKLDVPENYDSNEWIVICGYYPMYMAALALIAKMGFRSKNHTATLLALDEFFVKKNILDKRLLKIIKNALFCKEEIEKLDDAKHKREIAQYSITKQTTEHIAEKIKKDAYEFVNKCEEVLEK